jgi:hypothetical protein
MTTAVPLAMQKERVVSFSLLPDTQEATTNAPQRNTATAETAENC